MPGTSASRRSRSRPAPDPIPQPLTSFVGRERDIATVVDLLGRSDVRLLTLTGPGGVGKTRLALRAADEVRDTFTDGAVFVPLASVRDPAMLLPTVAHLLGVPDAPGQPVLSRLHAYLADRHLLLVLDNLEQLLDAVPAVTDLLAACPRLTILGTCRTKLNLSGEHLMPLAPLPAEEARVLLTERVQALLPGFTLTDELAPVVDEICTRLDGLPLAIELAASRVPALPPRALLARLERRLDLLTDGPRDAPARLRDMRDAIDWSHDLLSDAQQVLFRRLGVFIGGFTLVAATAVAGDDVDALDGVSALVAASLVVPTEGVADEPRYTMLETIREYALERLAAVDEEATTRARHAECFRALAEDAIPEYDGPNSRLASDRVDIELDNCRAAMTWALETREAETGVRLAGALWRIWWFAQATGGLPWTERVAEGLAWTERMLAMQEGLEIEALTEALTGAACLAALLGDHDRARTLAEDLLTRARAEAYPYGEYWALAVLGNNAKRRGDVASASHHYDECLELAPHLRNPQNHRSLAYFYLGIIAVHAGDPDEAARYLGEALRLAHETGNDFVIASAAGRLGTVAREQGDLEQAGMMARESLAAHARRRDLCGIRQSLVDLSLLALRAGQPERAARLLGVAETYPSYDSNADAYDAAAAPRAVTDAQARLGEAVFTVAFETGRNLAWDEVLTEVDALIAIVAGAPSDPATRHGLSPRELQVLQLLAEGGSDRTIADTLFVSQRTVATHIRHIYDKLGVNSRAAAATYAVRHGLL